MTFRAIRPATSIRGPPDDPPSSVGSSRATAQACHDCRRLKIKCDGNWPKCSTCAAKNRQCGYVGQEGQTRAAAVKSRLESLEEVMAALRMSNSDRVDQLLDCIRTTDDPVRIMENFGSCSDAQARLDPQSQLLILANRSIRDFRLLLPNSSLIMQAIDSFFNCSGKLFHVFSKDYILQCYHAVFDELQVPLESLKAKVCCLTAVASVGAQYRPDEISKEEELGLYNLARHLFEVAVEQTPLHAIKVCTLFAQYNIMNKEMVSLGYVETGLSMCHIYGISNRAIRPYSMPSVEWFDLRKTWRTLVFFSSWLSSTLGYVSGNSWMSDRQMLSDMKAEDPTNIADVVQTEMARICLLKADILRMHLVFKELTVPALEAIRRDLQNWYQELPEVMRIEASQHEGLQLETKRSILHLHRLYLGAIMLLYRRIATQFLQSYATKACPTLLQLPLRDAFAKQSADAIVAAGTSARILKLLLEDDSVFKHCWLVIFQTYTSCTILLHAIVQKQLHDFGPSSWEDDVERANDCLSVLAFCGTEDRVAAHFHEQLNSIFQRLLAQRSNSLADERYAQTEAQGETTQPNELSTPMEVETRGQLQLANYSYLLHIADHADAWWVKLSSLLLMMLSQPFGDPDTKEAAELNLKQHWLSDPSRYEYPQMAERLDWDIENSRLFQWDLSKLRFPSLDILKHAGPSGSAPSSFIGSDEPSGWKSAANFTSPRQRP